MADGQSGQRRRGKRKQLDLLKYALIVVGVVAAEIIALALLDKLEAIGPRSLIGLIALSVFAVTLTIVLAISASRH